MGWASGSHLMCQIIASTMEYVDDDDIRRLLYHDFIIAFESKDCDTLQECMRIDPAFDAEYDAMYPPED